MLQVLIILVVIGLLLYLAITYIPMEATIKKIVIAFVVICVVLWLLQIFGVLPMINVPVPRVQR